MRVESRLTLGGVLFLALAVLAGCTASDAQPDWLRALIAKTASEPPNIPPVSIVKGRYRGQTVYYRTPYCCDIAGAVFTEDGDVMCTAGGGITGYGDGRCRDFWSTLENCTPVWSDERGKFPGRNLCSQVAPNQ